MSKTIKFEKKDDRCYTADIAHGKAVRAIEENGHWRIDHCQALYGAWLPWEPIDQVKYRSANDAKVAIRGWAAE
jgi:hypothetical protein